MLRRPRRPEPRSGVATVEAAVALSALLVPLMIGVWEMGRFLYVQQVVCAAAREGARVAAQGNTLSATGSATQIVSAQASPQPSASPPYVPTVKGAVVQCLAGAGLPVSWNDVTVTFHFPTDGGGPMAPAPVPVAPAAPPAPDGSEPYQGAKGQRLTVGVVIPYSKVQWTILGLVKPSTVAYTVEWRMLVDDTFQVNVAVPTW